MFAFRKNVKPRDPLGFNTGGDVIYHGISEVILKDVIEIKILIAMKNLEENILTITLL